MRRRAKRDLLTLLGVVLILAGIVGANTYMRLDSIKEAARQVRLRLEEKHRSQGDEVLDWDLLHKTTGFILTGPTFGEGLKKLDEHLVNICGFMTPIDQFGSVTEFMLLRVPITCYFCDSPPARDIIHVKLDKPARMVNEAVLIGGRLELHEKEDRGKHKGKKGREDLFFYSIVNAKWNQAVKDRPVTRKTITEEHIIHHTVGFDKLRNPDAEEDAMLPGQEPPTLEEPTIKADDPSTYGERMGGHIAPVDMGPLVPGQEPPTADTDSEDASEGG